MANICSILIDGNWIQVHKPEFKSLELPSPTQVLAGYNGAGLEVAFPIAAISGFKYSPAIKEEKIERYEVK